jgi:hypothetical protein
MPQRAFDPDALISMFETASATQSARLQKAVTDATLAALRGRELTLGNIRSSLDSVAKAVNAGAAKNPLGGVAVEGMLDKAVAGMDAALLKGCSMAPNTLLAVAALHLDADGVAERMKPVLGAPSSMVSMARFSAMQP